MMPEDSVYGPWPRSGEIDIMESRGNSPDYPEGGRNFYYGTLHWGEQIPPPPPFFFPAQRRSMSRAPPRR